MGALHYLIVFRADAVGSAEADGDVGGEAGGKAEHPFLPAGCGEKAGIERAERCFPVDRCRPGAVVDEAPEVTAFDPGPVGDDQPGAGFERVEALGAGAEGGMERLAGHASPSRPAGSCSSAAVMSMRRAFSA